MSENQKCSKCGSTEILYDKEFDTYICLHCGFDWIMRNGKVVPLSKIRKNVRI